MNTTTTDDIFSLEYLEKKIEELKALPPVAIEIQVIQEVFDLMMDNINNISMLDNLKEREIHKEHGYISNGYGLRIIVVEDKEVTKDQMKVIYSNGSTELIKLNYR